MVQKLELSGYSCVWEEGFSRERAEAESQQRQSCLAGPSSGLSYAPARIGLNVWSGLTLPSTFF